MDNFDAHKWFKKEYLGEGHTEDKMERDMEARKRSKLSPDELKKLDAMRAFYRGETDVLPADLKEIASDGYVELMDIDDHLENIHYEWEKWREGPMTEPRDIDPAKADVIQYIVNYLKRSLK